MKIDVHYLAQMAEIIHTDLVKKGRKDTITEIVSHLQSNLKAHANIST